MTSEQFIKAIESYYGKYRPGVKTVVLQYLSTVAEKELSEIRKELLLTVSTQYGHVPDVATIEQARKDLRSSRPALPEYKPALIGVDSEAFNPELGGLLSGLVKKMRGRAS